MPDLSDDDRPDGFRRGAPLPIILGVLVSLLVIGWSLAAGSKDISLADVVAALWLRLKGGVLTQEFAQTYTILWDLRLPRTLLAFIGGAALSIAGVVMQGLLRNPLVSPFTLGISPAASFGAAIVIIGLGGTAATGNTFLIILSALAFSFACAILIMGLASFKSMSSASLILLGIALTQLFTALTAVLQYVADERALAAMMRWTFGSVNDATWPQVTILAIVLLVSLPLLGLKAKELNAIAFAGDESAKSFGINVAATRMALIAISVVLSSVVVSFTGVIGFVGLVGPHIARMLVGTDHRTLVPFSGLSGGIMLVLADLVGRLVLAPVVVPAGIVVALLGSIVFVHLILRNRQSS